MFLNCDPRAWPISVHKSHIAFSAQLMDSLKICGFIPHILETSQGTPAQIANGIRSILLLLVKAAPKNPLNLDLYIVIQVHLRYPNLAQKLSMSATSILFCPQLPNTHETHF